MTYKKVFVSYGEEKREETAVLRNISFEIRGEERVASLYHTCFLFVF